MLHSHPALSRSEWQAVSIALNDAARCGCTPQDGKLARLYRLLTGNRAAQPLADRRLEAVRSFVCATRARRRPAEAFVPALRDEGFNDGQVQALALLSL